MLLIMSGLCLSVPRDVCKTKMMSCNGQRATVNGQRVAVNGQRVAGNGQPAASDKLLAEGI